VRHLRRFTSFIFGVAIPKAGTSVLASSVTLASVLWVSMSLPNMPMLGSLVGERTTSVSISLQSALLGIDDGAGRSPRERRTLARVLGLRDDTINLHSLAELRTPSATPEQTPIVAQLAGLHIKRTTSSAPRKFIATHAQSTAVSGDTAEIDAVTHGPLLEPHVDAKVETSAPLDATAPTLHVPTDLRVVATSAAGAYVSYAASASDAIGGGPSVNCIPASGTRFPVGHTTVTCTAEDQAHNVSRRTFDVNVLGDRTPPTVQQHADVVAEATGPSGASVGYLSPTATDSVDGTLGVLCAPAAPSLFSLGTTTVTCSAEDESHNVGRATFKVLVRDTTAPSIQPHPDVIVSATNGDAVVTYTQPSSDDAVDGPVAVTCAPASGSAFPVGRTTVKCSAADAAGNRSSSRFDVNVRDTAPPVVQSHGNLVAEATGSGGTHVAYTVPAATDSLDGAVPVACAPSSGSLFALGHTTITCSTQDAAGNTAASTFDIQVRDTTAPTIQVHPDLVAEATGPSGASVAYSAPAATDVVDPAVAVNCTPASGSVFALGHTTVACGTQDRAGNSATASSFDIHVRDTTAPTIQAHANVTAEATAATGATVTYAAPTANDLVSGSATVTCAPASGSTFAVGHTTVTCAAQDARGNGTSSTFDIHVRDTTAPAIQAHANAIAEATGAAGATVTYTSPTASDLVSGSAAVTCAPASGSTFAVGHTTVTCSAQDAAGNTAGSTFDFHVRDTTSPTIQVHANEIAEATGAAGGAVSYTSPTASDLVSGSATVNCAPTSGSAFALGHTTVTCSTQDAAGNSASSTFDIHVRDTTGPAIQAHADLVAAATPGGTVVTYTSPTANDLVSGSVTVSCAPVSGSTLPLGHTTVTCSAQDAAGNPSSSHFDINVADSTPPVIQGHVNLVAEATGPSGAAVTYSTPTASDALDGAVAVACAPASGSVFGVGHNTVTCSAQDATGNSASSTFDIHVRDTVAPTIQGHANVTIEADTLGGASVTYSAPTGSDSVSPVTVTCAAPSGSLFALGHTTVICSAQDAAGNNATTSFDVYVLDTTAPTLTVPADIIAEADTSAGVAVSYTVTADDIADGSIAVSCDSASGSTFHMGHSTVTCTAVDSSGNSTSQTFDVHIHPSPHFSG
jgi:hypothetical protein